MTPVQTQLAHRRLRLGIVNVGSWVLAATAGLWLLTSKSDLSVGPGHAAVFVLVALGVQSIFDFVGGVLLMPPPRPEIFRFLRGWVRGVMGQTLILSLIVALSYLSLRLSGGFVAAIVVGTLGLTVCRAWCLHLIGGVRLTHQPANDGKVILAEASDPAFTGGAIGLGSRAVCLWPTSWWQRVPADEQPNRFATARLLDDALDLWQPAALAQPEPFSRIRRRPRRARRRIQSAGVDRALP